MVNTYEFSFDPCDATSDESDLTDKTQTKASGEIVFGITFFNRCGVGSDGSSVASSATAKLKNFNGYPLKNIGWEMLIDSTILSGLGSDTQMGVQFTFDNGDVMKIWAEGKGNVFLNQDYYMSYSGSQTQAAIKIGETQPSGNFNKVPLKIICDISGSDRRFTFFDTDDGDYSCTVSVLEGLNWDQFGASPFYTITGGKGLWITDMRLIAETDHTGGAQSEPLMQSILTLFLFTTEALFTGPHVSGLVLGDAEIVEYFGNSALGAGGIMSIIVADYQETNTDILLANNMGNEILINDAVYGNDLFRGEISDFKTITDSIIEFICDEGGRKLLNQPCNHNPIIASGFFGYLHDDTNEDKDADYQNTTTWIANNYPLTGEKAASNVIVVHSYSVTASEELDAINGLISYLYYDDGTRISDASGINAYNTADASHNVVVYDLYFDFYLHVKAGSTLESLVLKFKGGTSGGTFTTNPSIMIHDYDFPQAVTIYTSDESDGTTREIDLELNITGTLTDYLDAVGAENDSGFQKYNIRIYFRSGKLDSPSALGLQTYFAEIEATFDNDQTSGISIGKITTGTDSTTIVFDPAPSWALDDFPLADGFGKNDIFYVTKWMDAIFTDIFAAYDGTFVLDQNVTGLDLLAEARDLTQIMVYDLLQKYSTILNFPWWYNGLNSIVMRSLDNLTDSGITLTEADAVGGRGAIAISIDTDNLRNKLIINGDLVSGEVNITPEYALAQGNEVEIHEDPTINSAKHIIDALAKKKLVHTNASKYISIPLSFTNPVQSYENVALGSEIGMKYPNASSTKFDWTTGGLGKLFIIRIDISSSKSDGWNQKITLGLQRRYS